MGKLEMRAVRLPACLSWTGLGRHGGCPSFLTPGYLGGSQLDYVETSCQCSRPACLSLILSPHWAWKVNPQKRHLAKNSQKVAICQGLFHGCNTMMDIHDALNRPIVMFYPLCALLCSMHCFGGGDRVHQSWGIIFSCDCLLSPVWTPCKLGLCVKGENINQRRSNLSLSDPTS